MFPATPTPFPDVIAPQIVIDAGDWGLWNYTDEAIQAWNKTPGGGAVIQYAVLLIIIISFVALLIKLVNDYREQSK